MNPPPPMLPAVGCVTASAKPVATAASTALPPRRRIAAPTSDAIDDVETTNPLVDGTPAASLTGNGAVEAVDALEATLLCDELHAAKTGKSPRRAAAESAREVRSMENS